MDLTLLYLVAGFVVSALYFEFRVRRFMRKSLPRALETLQSAFFTSEVTKDEDGTERVLLRPNSRLEALAGAVAPVFIAAALKSIKLKPGSAGLPPGIDLSNLAQSLPQLILAMPGKNLNLGGLKIPKEIVAAFAPMLQGFFGGVGGSKTKPSGPVPEEIVGPGR